MGGDLHGLAGVETALPSLFWHIQSCAYAAGSSYSRIEGVIKLGPGDYSKGYAYWESGRCSNYIRPAGLVDGPQLSIFWRRIGSVTVSGRPTTH